VTEHEHQDPDRQQERARQDREAQNEDDERPQPRGLDEGRLVIHLDLLTNVGPYDSTRQVVAKPTWEK